MDYPPSSFMPNLPFVPTSSAIRPIATPEPTSEPRAHREPKGHRYDFGPAAPSENLPFPLQANLTLVELLTFLPNSVRCADVVCRIISNGGTRRALWAIVNTQRDLLVEWSKNLCGAWIYKAMNDAGYKGWTVKIHDQYHQERKATWDEANLNVAGFRTPGQMKGNGRPAADIPFKNLATDVRQMPQREDALDLTRMVEYCVQRPNEPWMYPRDYNALLGLLGGPAVVRKEHLDRAAFIRRADIAPAPPRNGPANPLLGIQGAAKENKRKRGSSERGDTPVMGYQYEDLTPAPATYSQGATPELAIQPKKRGRPKGIPKSTLKNAEEAAAKQINDEEEVASKELYVRGPADYVAAPSDVDEPADETIELAFLKEGAVAEDDPFSPYAFGGPRSSAPYRSLHRMGQPHPGDISGWAENLRWAYEQRACFWYSFRTDAWNESPEHMEFIAKTRKEQVWASDELQDFVVEEQLREEENERRLYHPGTR